MLRCAVLFRHTETDWLRCAVLFRYTERLAVRLVCAHEQPALSFVSALGSIAAVTKCPVLRAITVPRRCKVFQTLGVGRQTLT